LTAIGSTHHRLDFLIRPDRPLDPDRHFIICADAIGNGLTTSPSNSPAQPDLAFPRFTIRDMVESQRRLLDSLRIRQLAAVVGASMGGMQTLQWGVNDPDRMRSIVALVPMARTRPWSVAMNEVARRILMADPGWPSGPYGGGFDAWAALSRVITNRTPGALETGRRGGGSRRTHCERHAGTAGRQRRSCGCGRQLATTGRRPRRHQRIPDQSCGLNHAEMRCRPGGSQFLTALEGGVTLDQALGSRFAPYLAPCNEKQEYWRKPCQNC
jgi:pimeloyl-ACP methyl ester carboxylesterase